MAPKLRPVDRAFTAIAEAIFAEETAPPAARLAWLSAELVDFLGRTGRRTRWLVGLAALSVTWIAPWFIGRWTRFDRLALKERVRALRRLEASRLAAPLFAVKALLSLIYYEHPDAARGAGFDGRCLKGHE